MTESQHQPASADKCPNVEPLRRRNAAGELLRAGTCPACGGYLVILSSGAFRRHRPVFKPGSRKLADALARAEQ